MLMSRALSQAMASSEVHSAEAGPYQVGIVEVRVRVADQYGRDTSSVGSAQHCSQIAWLLDRFYDNYQGSVSRVRAFCAGASEEREVEGLERPVLSTAADHCEKSLGTAPVGHFPVNVLGDLEYACPFISGKGMQQWLCVCGLSEWDVAAL